MERGQSDGDGGILRERVRVGEGGMHCSFPGDCALPALRGRRHDNHHGCRCHSFITPLSSPSPPIPRSLSLSPPPSPSLRLVFLSPLSSLASFTSHPGLLSLLLSLLLLPFKHSEWGKKHPDEKMAVVFHLYSRCV